MAEHDLSDIKVLVVDDEPVVREMLEDFLDMEGFETETASGGQEALEILEEESFDVVVSDLMMEPMNGLQLLEAIRERGYLVSVVMVTGYGTVETAVSALKAGAFDYILKPFKPDEVVQVIKRAVEHKRLREDNVTLREVARLYTISQAIAEGSDIHRIMEMILDTTLGETEAGYAVLNFRGLGARDFFTMERFSGDNRVALDVEALREMVEREGSVLMSGDDASGFILHRVGEPTSMVAVPLMFKHNSLGLLVVVSFDRRRHFTEGMRKFMDLLATRAAATLENARLVDELRQRNRELEKLNRFLEENFRQTIVGFINAIEKNDPYTKGHSVRVSVYSRWIAEELGLPSTTVDEVTFAGQLHDIGKIGIPHHKLNKPGALEPGEIKMFRLHPEMGKQILEPIPYMRRLIDGVYTHHERYDGRGYPQGLTGEEIPLIGRIIAVADAFDAMTSDRSYRRALPKATAIEELKSNAGTQFDAAIVEAFLSALAKHEHELEWELR